MPRQRSTVVPAQAYGTDRYQGLRHALTQTLPGRGLVVGLVVKVAGAVLRAGLGVAPAFLGVIETTASLLVAAALVYFLGRLFLVAKRRLLWRVRRKLILSYIFIGFVPALLIIAFFLLCALLLFYNFSSYLVQARLRTWTEQAQFQAANAAFEVQRSGGRDLAAIVARRQAAAGLPSLAIAIVKTDRTCGKAPAGDAGDVMASQAGDWDHVTPPASLPSWIDCGGWSGLLAYTHDAPGTKTAAPASAGGAAAPAARTPGAGGVVVNGQSLELGASDIDTHMLVRAVAMLDARRPGYAVVVDVPFDDRMRQQLRDDTGVEFRKIVAVPGAKDDDAHPLEARGSSAGHQASGQPLASGPLTWVSFLEYRDWSTGAMGTLFVSTQLNIADIYARISAAQGRIGTGNFNQALLLVLLVVVGGLFLVIQIVALIVGLALARSITGSVHELFTGTERVRQGDFTHKIAVKAQDQLGELAVSFNSMTASIEDLLRQAAEKKRLEEELRIAREIQMSLLPQGALSWPGVAVTALCVPAREVGGDYYDLFPLGHDRVGVLIADVSGKGTSAALYMAELKGLMLSLSQIHPSPRELMIAANRIIAKNLDARSFITMTYAVIDLRARTMTWARAGHTPLIYVPGPGADSRRARILAPDGLVLGLKIDDGTMFEQLLEEQTLRLEPGDLFVFFTDGISESMNAADDCFGEERLGALLEVHGDLPGDELRERLLHEIDAFVGNAPQHDDMTMILLRIDDLPPEQPGAPVRLAGMAG